MKLFPLRNILLLLLAQSVILLKPGSTSKNLKTSENEFVLSELKTDKSTGQTNMETKTISRDNKDTIDSLNSVSGLQSDSSVAQVPTAPVKPDAPEPVESKGTSTESTTDSTTSPVPAAQPSPVASENKPNVTLSSLTGTVRKNSNDNQIIEPIDPASVSNGILHQPPQVNDMSNENKLYFRVGGYIGAWRKDSEISKIPVENMDTLYYAFINVDTKSGKCVLPQMEKEKMISGVPSTFDSIKKLKEKNNSLTVMASIGGWKFSPAFYQVAMLGTDEQLQKLATSCFELIDSYGLFDGIDINLEFPCPKGRVCRESFTQVTEDDRAKYSKVVAAFKKVLVLEYKLSITVSADPELASQVDYSVVGDLVNWVNVMTYDFHTKRSKMAGHHTNAFSSEGNEVSVASVSKFYTSILKVQPSKINIGVAFYARGFKTKGNCNYNVNPNCMVQQGESARIDDHEAEYRRIKADYLYYGDKVYYDEKAKAKYIYDRGDIYSFDEPNSVKEKVKLVNEYQFAGVFAWELCMDSDDFELLNSIYKLKNNK